MKKKEVFPTETVQFNGIELICVVKPEMSQIAIKPLCAALGLDFSNVRRFVNKDPILGPAWSTVTTQIDGQAREYACLPERYIYGFLFVLPDRNGRLTKYKQEIHDLLFDHFHGVLGERRAILRDRKSVDHLIKQLEAELKEDPRQQQLDDLKKKKRQIGNELRSQDNRLAGMQGDIFE